MKDSCDVLIVGAGPAGSVAALVLARAGVTVGIVDRAQFPRDKLCGDTLNPGALAILDRLGASASLTAPAPLAPATRGGLADRVRHRALPITGMTVTGPGGATVGADYPEGLRGAAIARHDLDRLMLDAAVAAGATIFPAMRVHAPLLAPDGAVIGVRANGARDLTLRARVVIAADGRRSTLAFALNLARFPDAPRRWAFGGYFSDVDGLTSRGEMHLRAGGYVGIAPLPGELVNVCVVRELRRARPCVESVSGLRDPRSSMPVPAGRAGDVIAEAIAADPHLRARFARARRVSRVRTLGPLAVEARAAGCPGLLLAGDAAGFVDPMTGDGLRFALRSGELAARAALDELASGAPAFKRLGAARAREFGGKWRLNRGLRWLVGSPRGLSVVASLAPHWPTPVRALIAVAGDVRLAQQHESRRSQVESRK